MGFLAPISALVAAAVVIPPLVALYFLKLRRREVAVPSTLLWKKAIQDLQVNAPFQRLRRNLLLLLQLLLLAALLLAFARPTTQTAANPGQRVVLVVDHSASMNADEGGRTRLDRAKDAAIDIVASLVGEEGGGEGGAMVVSFAGQARVVQPFTGDPSLLRDAVRGIPPTDQAGRLDAALRLVEPFAAQAAEDTEQELIVYVLSDGRVPPPAEGDGAVSLAGADIRFVQVAQRPLDAANVGIVSFSARRDFERPQVVQVFARLSNDGGAAVTMNATLRVDDRVQSVQRVTVPVATDAGPGSRSIQFELAAPGSAMIELSHDHADALDSDDAARLHLAPARRVRVLLVSEGNPFLERVLRSVGVRELSLMSPGKYEDQDPASLRRSAWGRDAGSNGGFDLIVFDRYAPRTVPPTGSVSFAAAPPVEGLRFVPPEEAGRDETGVVLDWSREHPVMRYAVMDDVLIRGAGRLVVPGEATVLAVGEAGPLIAETPAGGARHVAVAFDVRRSSWPAHVSFPVFVSNVIAAAGGLGEASGVMFKAGDVAVVPVARDAASVAFTGPVPLEARAANGQAVLPMFPRAGVYGTAGGAVEPPYDLLPVNVLDPLESDTRPAEVLAAAGQTAQGTPESRAVRREIWPWFVWGALGLLLVEWVVYTRRMHL